MRGDTGALERLEGSSRRANRSQKILKRKLDKTKRNRGTAKATARARVLDTGVYSSSDFTSVSIDPVAVKRLATTIGQDGHRVFYVGELGVRELENVSAVVVAPASAEARVARIQAELGAIESVSKEMPILKLYAPMDLAGSVGSFVVVRRVAMKTGECLFTARTTDDTVSARACDLQLSQRDHKRIASCVASLLCVRLEIE